MGEAGDGETSYDHRSDFTTIILRNTYEDSKDNKLPWHGWDSNLSSNRLMREPRNGWTDTENPNNKGMPVDTFPIVVNGVWGGFVLYNWRKLIRYSVGICLLFIKELSLALR